MTAAVLFDLDETLMIEEPAAVAAFYATADTAAEQHRLDVPALALAARMCARDLWRESPARPYCRRVGISSWEGLWCRFSGPGQDLSRLRAWAPTYRREAWRRGLVAQGIDDLQLAAKLGDRFASERRSRHAVFPDAAPALRLLATTHQLGLVTNGARCLQREKLAASGLAAHLHAVVVSADLGTAKPDPTVFGHALRKLGASAAETIMVGDSVTKDIAGARAAGLGAVWLNRAGGGEPPGAALAGVLQITALDELAPLLASGRPAWR
jgi:putative hydrolase of the HAD superfamily